MPSSRSATHRAGHASNPSAASTAKTGTSSVLEPKVVAGAGDLDDLAGRRDPRRSGAQFVDGPERVGCAVREHRRHLDERPMLDASLPRQKRCPVQRSACGHCAASMPDSDAFPGHAAARVTLRRYRAAQKMYSVVYGTLIVVLLSHDGGTWPP